MGKLIVEAQGGEKRAKYGDGLIKEYERLDDKTKEKILTNKKNKIEDFLKDPILIKNSSITC